MKAILVIDEMPENCAECPLMYWSICGETCKVILSSVPIEERPLWCPLKLMPDRKEDLHYPCNEYVQAVNEGWNACLDAITGDEE